MSDHLRLVSDNTDGKIVPGPGLLGARDASPKRYFQTFVFVEENGLLVIMHNGKEVDALVAVDAMAAVASHLYRRGRAAKSAAAAPPREPTIYDDIGAGALDVRRARPSQPIAAEDSPEDGA